MTTKQGFKFESSFVVLNSGDTEGAELSNDELQNDSTQTCSEWHTDLLSFVEFSREGYSFVDGKSCIECGKVFGSAQYKLGTKNTVHSCPRNWKTNCGCTYCVNCFTVKMNSCKRKRKRVRKQLG